MGSTSSDAVPGPALAGIVLAAGAGRRFGGAKQVAPLDGKPLLQHVVDAMAAVEELAEIFVVLGAHAEAVRSAVDFGRSTPILNRRWEDGLAASLRVGFGAAAAHDWAIVVLGDQPLIGARAVRSLARAAASELSADVLRARYEDGTGHPTAIRRRAFGLADWLEGDTGFRSLFDAVELRDVPVPAGAANDVDHQADLARLSATERP